MTTFRHLVMNHFSVNLSQRHLTFIYSYMVYFLVFCLICYLTIFHFRVR